MERRDHHSTADTPVAFDVVTADPDPTIAGPLADFETAGANLATVLHSLESADRYNRWILDLAAAYLGDEVAEVGAGDGNITTLLAARGHRVVAAEPFAPLARRLRARVAGLDAVTAAKVQIVEHDAFGLDEAAFDSTILVNVLEHIDDDAAALVALRRAVRPGGHVVLFVPAFALLHSDFDRQVGHHRRYTRRRLRRLLADSGWTVVDARYVNLPGWFAWLLVARLLGRVPTTPRRVQTYDRFVVPWLQPLERRFPPPFGQSLFIVGRRPTNEHSVEQR